MIQGLHFELLLVDAGPGANLDLLSKRTGKRGQRFRFVAEQLFGHPGRHGNRNPAPVEMGEGVADLA